MRFGDLVNSLFEYFKTIIFPSFGRYNQTNNFIKVDLPTINGRIAKLIVKKYLTCSMNIFGN